MWQTNTKRPGRRRKILKTKNSNQPYHSNLNKYQYKRKNNFTDKDDYYPNNDIYDYHNEPYQGSTDLQEEEDIDCSKDKYTYLPDDLELNQFDRNVKDKYEYDYDYEPNYNTHGFQNEPHQFNTSQHEEENYDHYQNDIES